MTEAEIRQKVEEMTAAHDRDVARWLASDNIDEVKRGIRQLDGALRASRGSVRGLLEIVKGEGK